MSYLFQGNTKETHAHSNVEPSTASKTACGRLVCEPGRQGAGVAWEHANFCAPGCAQDEKDTLLTKEGAVSSIADATARTVAAVEGLGSTQGERALFQDRIPPGAGASLDTALSSATTYVNRPRAGDMDRLEKAVLSARSRPGPAEPPQNADVLRKLVGDELGVEEGADKHTIWRAVHKKAGAIREGVRAMYEGLLDGVDQDTRDSVQKDIIEPIRGENVPTMSQAMHRANEFLKKSSASSALDKSIQLVNRLIHGMRSTRTSSAKRSDVVETGAAITQTTYLDPIFDAADACMESVTVPDDASLLYGDDTNMVMVFLAIDAALENN